MALTDKLVNIAEAIRSKTNSTDGMTLDQMPGKIRGITTSGGGVTLPELENPASASDLASGKQLIDGNGNVVEGAVPVVTGDARYMAWDIWDSNSSEVDEPYVSEYPNCVQIRGVIYDEILIRQHSGMYAYVPKNIFGDASPGDVRKGKIFTSEFGVKAVGTMEESGGESSSELFIGGCGLEYGQFTPTVTGNFTIKFTPKKKTLYAAVWLADASVVAEKYASANIMLESHGGMAGGYKTIHYSQNGAQAVVQKSQFGLAVYNTEIHYESHANWPGQPETYNWLIVYEV